MSITARSGLGSVAIEVGDALRRHGIRAVLTGGACACLRSGGAYDSVDIDFILLGHEKVGSFALSSNKTDLFATALGAWLQMIADVLDEGAARLLSVNGLPGRCCVKPGDIESPDLTELGDYITKLTSAGVPLFPDADLEKHLRDAAHLPAPSATSKPRGKGPLPEDEEVDEDG